MWSGMVIGMIGGGAWGYYTSKNKIRFGIMIVGCLVIGMTAGTITSYLGLP